VRYRDLVPCRNAFIDTRTPGSDAKENFTIIGPGVAENPEQHVHITEAHGFNIGGARQPPRCINSQHSHDTAEVFVVHSGRWRFTFGEHGEDAQVDAEPGDIVSFPIHAFRGFENIGERPAFCGRCLGGDDPGRVLWAPKVFEMAAEYGLILLENGALVDTYIEEDFARWPEFEKSARYASHSDKGVIELMPTSDGAQFAFKYVNGHPSNALSGLQTVVAFGVLANVATGYPELISEMTILTALRTAATSALAARRLARPDASTMAMIGLGAQSEFQAHAFKALLGIKRLRVFDVDPDATSKFMANLGDGGFEIVPVASTEEAVIGADPIGTGGACTRSMSSAARRGRRRARVLDAAAKRAQADAAAAADIFIAGLNEIDGGKRLGRRDGPSHGALFERALARHSATLRIVMLRYCEFNRVEDGKIVETAMFCDIPHLMMQAGQNPFPPQTGAMLVQPGPRTHTGLCYDKQDPARGEGNDGRDQRHAGGMGAKRREG
jgi:ornithine cyclodeaminase/alanine dehydrogenase-like protein (mu-crystallin family)/mannose-6-phosphate isomerase-like protein (cupin superfamily)